MVKSCDKTYESHTTFEKNTFNIKCQIILFDLLELDKLLNINKIIILLPLVDK